MGETEEDAGKAVSGYRDTEGDAEGVDDDFSDTASFGGDPASG